MRSAWGSSDAAANRRSSTRSGACPRSDHRDFCKRAATLFKLPTLEVYGIDRRKERAARAKGSIEMKSLSLIAMFAAAVAFTGCKKKEEGNKPAPSAAPTTGTPAAPTAGTPAAPTA